MLVTTPFYTGMREREALGVQWQDFDSWTCAGQSGSARSLGCQYAQELVDLYGHFIPGENGHHVESMAEAIEEARTQEGRN